MQKAIIINKLIKKNYKTLKAFCDDAHIPYSTLKSILSRGAGNASVDVMLKICGTLNITIEQLDAMSKGLHPGEYWEKDELAEINQFKEFILYKRNFNKR